MEDEWLEGLYEDLYGIDEPDQYYVEDDADGTYTEDDQGNWLKVDDPEDGYGYDTSDYDDEPPF